MSQSLSAQQDDGEDEPTQSYTQSQIQTLRDSARIYVVRPEDFVNFGDAGTPAGMIGSHNAASLTCVGSCGDPVVELEKDWGSSPMPVAAAVPDVPLARVGALYWETAHAEIAAVAAPIEEDAPTTRPALQSESSRTAGENELFDLEQSLARKRRSWPIIVAPLSLLGFALVGWSILGSETPVESSLGSTEFEVHEESVPSPPPQAVEEVPQIASQPVPPAAPPPESEAPDDDHRKSRTPAHETTTCVTRRQNAEAAQLAGNWARVEEGTSKRVCWANANEYKKLRMEALFELGRLDECIELGKGSQNKDVKLLRKRCLFAKK